MKTEEIIDDCINKVIQAGYMKRDEIAGLTDEDVLVILRDNKMSSLPNDYLIFLKKYGSSRGILYNGMYMTSDYFESSKSLFESLLRAKDLEDKIPQKYLIFCSNMDYFFSLLIEKLDGEFELASYTIADDFIIDIIPNFLSYIDENLVKNLAERGLY